MDRSAGRRAGAGQLSLFGESPRGGTPGAQISHGPRQLGGGTAERGLLQLAGRVVEYRFTRARRRTIGIRIDAAGLAVGAPLRAPWAEVERFLRAKQDWIVAKLNEWSSAPAPRVLRGVEGEALPLHGEPLSLTLRAAPRGVRIADGRMIVSLREPQRRERVLAMIQRWLKERALSTLAPRVAHYAERLGRPAPRVALSSARRQWGVCVRRPGENLIRLNWRLVQLPPALADYVVAHEAAHLVEMNHSRRFWAVVESLYPDWRAARRRLESAAAALPVFGRAIGEAR
jgi:predicted metal-dependent hydrolase